MSNPFIGQIILFAGNFAPKGWALCQGQTLAIQQNAALFAIIGTTYGGNGTSTFQLPDLRGRVAVSQGQGPNTSNYSLGQQTGTEQVTLTTSQMPSHSHNVLVNAGAGTQASPNGNFLAQTGGRSPGDTYNTTSSTNAILNQASIQANGSSQPHNNLQPLLALNYIIALQGIYPSRD